MVSEREHLDLAGREYGRGVRPKRSTSWCGFARRPTGSRSEKARVSSRTAWKNSKQYGSLVRIRPHRSLGEFYNRIACPLGAATRAVPPSFAWFEPQAG